jgi:prevent-host-death family protein
MNQKTIGAFEAKTRLSELLEQVRKGQVYRISKRGRPIAELRPLASPDQRPRFGSDRGRVAVGDDFDEPLPGMESYTK